ncbi:helix-turn-helix domain-containing protein [Microbacterium sp. NPDC057407]|uniref:helix-turn-helix domain-containing protein n=1 Tax=Microbacterium sp. NPDC057407 TaxID=3346120 RepID=UPI00366F3938
MDTAIADRVRAIITNLGVSDKTFAVTIGMPVDQLSKSLNGKRKFSAYELAVIAEAGNVSVDWLSTGVQRHRLGLAARTVGLGLLDYESEARALAERYVDASDVLLELDRRSPLPPLPTLPTSGRFVEEGRKAAEWALGRIDATVLLGPTAELVEAIETSFGVDVANASEMPVGFDGLAFQDDSVRLVLLLTTENWTRRRFTIAHELGHIVWGDAHEVIAESLNPGGTADYKEKRANAFAAAFLMPETLLNEELAGRVIDHPVFHELVVRFRVSPSSLAVRLKSLSFIDEATFNQLRHFRTRDSIAAIDGAAAIEIHEIAGAQVPLAPAKMVTEFLAAYREGIISSAHLVNLTGQPESSWRELLNDSLPSDDLEDGTSGPIDADTELAFAP